MAEQYFQVKVNNISYEPLEYVVATYDEDSKELWFWGTWNDENKAKEAVNQLDNAILLRRK